MAQGRCRVVCATPDEPERAKHQLTRLNMSDVIGLLPKDVDAADLRERLLPLLRQQVEETWADWASVPKHWTARRQACERKVQRLRKIMVELAVLAEFSEEIKQVG